MTAAPGPRRSVGPRRVVLWDLDGTLADSEPLHARALAAPFAAEGLQPPEDMHRRVLGLSAQAIHALFQQECGLRMGFDHWLSLRWAAYLADVTSVKARAGALETFDTLEALGYRQAVVSNSDRAIVQANLAAIGLGSRVAFALCREDVPRPKPDPAPYLAAAARMGVAPAEAAVVEDSAAGARSGVAAGCFTVYWPENDDHPPPLGSCLAQNPEALRRILIDPSQADLI